MVQITSNPSGYKGAPKRPSSGKSAKQAAQFPSVGMTLRSYQYDAKDRYRNPGARGVVVRQNRWQKLRQKVTWKRTLIVFAILALIIGGWVGGKFIYNFQKLFGGNIFGVLSSTKLKGEDEGRVNILLAGNSADDVGHNGGELTDSIMLISVDTKNNKAFLLSIPRDLWVDIPGEGHAKINEAYVDGEATKFNDKGYTTEGGMGLLEKVVEDHFDIDVHYTSLVNYRALKEAVDAVGGVDFTVKSSDPRGVYDPNIDYVTRKPLVKLSNGTHHLNGQEALNLSRARGNHYRSYGLPAGDFDRAANQRQLMIALKNKAVSAGVLANPAKLSSLSDAIGRNVKTTFSVSEVRRLYDISKKINSNNIQSLSLNEANGKNLLESYNARGQSALIPALGIDEFYDIQQFLRQQMSNNPVVQEGAKIAVLNSTDTGGLASKEKTALQAKKFYVSDVGDAESEVLATSKIIDVSAGKKPGTLQQLIKIYGNNVSTTNPYAGTYDADFIVIIGSDRIPKTTTTSQ
jgi:polyisoprenyl-teichoic acid--peptidoglycan teichoic acid transferase